MASEKSSTGILVSPILIGTVFIFTIFSSRVSGSAANALQLCGTSVIPSLFPFMVLSSMAVSVAAHIKSPSVRWTIVIILGLLCGLPVGVSALCHGVDDGQMNRNSGALVPILFATASPSFIVDVIGKSFWGSRELGWIFCFCQISSFAFVYWWFSAVSSFSHK